ncbi:MFS transporter [Conexibacter arvalis]|uniref:EmrB/QacA subfamily drug resistance transporter n=1 Tax=Conexibacter arvalis TaxID=912552 RepID=A0A840I9G2_9ACTN|nr:MFS transporter [Conexibacter arvalis]MBB4660873.1 EmrB/QacA subfamily drug resistance transporter [Conexibacter arvalis]
MSSTAFSTPPAIGRRAAPAWLAMAVVLTGTFVVTLDFFIVNVAIPATQADLRASDGAMQLVIAAYGVALAAGLILGGRLGDLCGRRRMFAIGLALFTASSALCGAAPNADVLIAARVVQGLAAALMSPQALSIVGLAYEGEARTRAFAVYGLVMGLAAASGQLIGGLLIELDLLGLGWRSCYLVNVPIGIAALAITPYAIGESRAESGARLDLAGAVLATAALLAVVLPLVLGREHGWPLWAWLSLAAAPVLLAAFAFSQRRLAARGGDPLVPPLLFRERAFTVGLLATILFYTGMGSFFLVLALHLQHGRGLDALGSGLVFTPLAVGYLAASIAAQRLHRLGRQLLALGAVVRGVALVGLLATVAAVGAGGELALLLPALVVDGIGMGLLTAPLIATVLADLSPRHAGAASGVLSTAQQVGNALGIAVVGALFYGALGAAPAPDDVARAFELALIVVAALSLLVALLVQALPGVTARADAAAAPAPAHA